MRKNRLEWLKRGMCIALAGVMLVSSDAVMYAAEAGVATVAETGSDVTETSDDVSEDVTQDTSQTEATETTENTGTEQTEATETTESTGATEATETTENTEATEETEVTEVTEETEVTEDTEDTEVTEVTEETESTELDVDDAGKAAKVPEGITFDPAYTITDIGTTLSLPEYTITYEDKNAVGDEAEVTWESLDDFGIITLDADNDRVIADKAGTAKIRASVKGTKYTADFLIVVRPAAATNIKAATTTYNSVKFTWDGAADAEGYQVYRKAKGETDFTLLKTLTDTTYTDTNLVAGREYAYRVYSYVSYKISSTAYAEAEAPAVLTVTPTVGKTTISSVTSKAYNTLALSWSKVDGAAGYTVYRATGNSSSYSEVGSVDAATYTYADAKVTCGVKYSYKVRAYSTVDGNKVYGAYSSAVSGKAVPAATTIAATVKGYEAVGLSWGKVSGASGYAVYRKTGNGSYKKIETLSGASSTSYTDENVDTGTKYTYKVRAYRMVDDETVWAAYSNEVSATPTMSAPTVTLQNKTYNSVVVKWKGVSGADGYKVARATSQNGTYTTVKNVKDSDITTYTDTGLKVGTTYYYKVYAYRSMDDGNVKGKKSDAVSIKAVPSATTVTSEAAGITAVKLNWSKVSLPSSNSGYYVYQITNGTAKKVKTCDSSTTSAKITNLTAGTKYNFKVVAFAKSSSGKVVEGLSSNTLSVSPTLLAPTISSAASSSYNTVKVSWKASKTGEEDSYQVYRATSKKGNYKKVGTVKHVSGTKSYTYTDSGVKLGTKYYYKIKCVKTVSGKALKSGYSGVKSITAAPATTSLTVKTKESGKLSISWKAVNKSSGKKVNGYVLYRSTSKNGKYTKVKTITSGSKTSYTDSGLTNGRTYYYKIRTYATVSGKNVYSEYSSVKSKKVVPTTPSIKAASINYKTITVSWNKVSGCDGYVVYRATSKNGKYTKVKTITSSGKTSWKNGKLKTGKTYYYKVRAYDVRDDKRVYSEYSKVKSATPVLGKPTGLTAMISESGQVKLTWKKVTGAKSYTILRSTSQNGKYRIATEICSTNSYTDTNVKAGKTYYYKVYAVRGDYNGTPSDIVTAMATSLTTSVESVAIKTGSFVKVTATAKPSAYIAWTSDNPTIAVVSSDGTIYGMKEGTTTIRAVANGISKAISVTVKDNLTEKGIEVSSDNGTVDFNSLRAAGYSFAIIRLSGGTTKDPKFETNYKKAKAAGMKVAVYCVTTATSAAAAENEAATAISYLNGRSVDYPVIYQIPYESFFYGGTPAERSKRVLAFKNKITAATYNNGTTNVNYGFALGAEKSWLMNTGASYFDLTTLGAQNLWVTTTGVESAGSGYTGSGKVIMWRYTNQGTANGISGKCNIDISY